MDIEDAAGKLYKRLYVSLEDLGHAYGFSSFILKNGWHFDPWEKRGSIYLQQSAFTSALIVFYARPFTRSYGLPDFPTRLIPYDEKEMQLHKTIMDLRHQVYAHSDSHRYKVTPLRIFGQASAIVGGPFFKLTKKQTQQLHRMIKKTQTAIELEINMLLGDIEKASSPAIEGR